jgi:signal transduction histidine kinase
LQEEVIDIVELLRQTTGMFVEQARQSGIIVANELLGDEPALLADRQQVMQMLVNLI